MTDKHDMEPSNDLKLQFEAVSRFPKEENRIVKALLKGMILKHEPDHQTNA